MSAQRRHGDAFAAVEEHQKMTLTTIEQLVIIRRRLGLTVQRAARRWRLNPITLGAWEQGTRTPRDSNAERLKRIVEREGRAA